MTRSVFHALACVATVFLAAATGVAYQATRAATAGRASVSGVIVSGDDARAAPVARALVTLTGGEAETSLVAISDDDGQFLFGDVPAGDYTLSATKATFVTAFWGSQRRGRGPGAPIEVAENQQVRDLRLNLAAGAAIAGHVADQLGRPQRGVVISIVESRNGLFGAKPAMLSTKTDDRGEYRVYGIAPGRYIVAAQPVFNFSGAVSTDGTTRVTYPTSFYPGTGDPGAAEVILVSASEEHQDIDIPLQLVAGATLRGRVVDSRGGVPGNVQMFLSWSGERVGLVDRNDVGGPRTLVAHDGVFTRAGLAPGHYVLTARAKPDLWGEVAVDVTGKDLAGIVLTMAPASRVHGRLVFDGTAPAAAAASSLRIHLDPVGDDRPALSAASIVANASADGTFALEGVVPGDYRFTVTGQGAAAWALASVTSQSHAVDLDTALRVSAGEDLNDLVLRLTDHPTVLTGTLVDGLGRPAPQYIVVVFATERKFWTAGSPRIRQIKPSSEGRFSLLGLPPGDYSLAAVTTLEPGDADDGTFLDMLTASAIHVTLGDGERKSVALTIASLPREPRPAPARTTSTAARR